MITFFERGGGGGGDALTLMSYTTLSHMNCTVLNSTIEYSLDYVFDHILREATLFLVHHTHINALQMLNEIESVFS